MPSLAAALIAGTALLTAPVAHAAVPATSVLEGFLNSTGGGAVADGLYDVTFAIYNVQTDGSAAWSEGPLKVEVKGGKFTHVLGGIKPLTAAILDQLSAGWLGLKVGADPELPRQRLRSVAYALLAGAAKALACSGCITNLAIADKTIAGTKVAFNYADSATKGGPAKSAQDLKCSNCVGVDELNIDKTLDLGGNALKAKAVAADTVTAGVFKGSGAELTGIKIPTGECKNKGEVVQGIDGDGKLKCVAAVSPDALPGDGIDEISNNLIHNQFENEDCIANPVPISDSNPTGVAASLVFGNYGLAQKLEVLFDMKNSDMKSVVVKLWDPDNVEYVLWNKDKAGTSLSGNWPTTNQTVSGDLSKWVNKNPQGKWLLQVIDYGTHPQNQDPDGSIDKFCIKIKTLSNQKVEVKGDLLVGSQAAKKKLIVNGDVEITGSVSVGVQPWQFHFPAGSRPFLFGFYGDRLNNNKTWGYKYDRPYDVPIDIRGLHRSTQSIVWGDDRGNIHFQRGGENYSSTSDHSQMVLAAFIKNTTGSIIKHTVYFYYTSRGTNTNHGGISINKENTFTQGGNVAEQKSYEVSFPANKTSVLLIKSGQYQYDGWYGYWNRVMVGWYNDTWGVDKMPKGLEWDYEKYWQWMKGG